MDGMRRLVDLEYDDEEKYERMGFDEPEPVSFPPGLRFTIDRDELAKIADGDAAPDHTLRFAALGTATSVSRTREPEDCRIEIELAMMAGPDGQFVELEHPPSIALTSAECEKLDLDEECERGDMLHLVGTARVESTSDHEFGSSVTLQITELAVEDESEESRDG